MRSRVSRYSAVAFGAVLLTSAGSAVAATAEERDSEGVDVHVSIDPPTEPGTLALTVAANSTTLTEADSTEAVREFTGALPDVTVTDTRAESEIPEGSSWYVIGTAGDFTSASGDTISADHLGWAPRFVGGDDAGDGVISVGGDVETVLDGDRGLVDQELLYLGDDLPAAEGGGSWTASADLYLRGQSTVAPGDYSSVITLSLFE